MLEFNLIDTAMSGHAVPGRPPTLLRWHAPPRPGLPTFWSQEKIFDAPADGGAHFALMLESKAIVPQLYQRLPAVVDRFRLVFTHDSAMLKAWPDRCRFVPANGVWVGGSYGGGSVGLHPKSKLVSMLSSTKLFCPLHKFRLDIARALSGVKGIDVTIAGHEQTGAHAWRPVSTTLIDYMYSIVMENYVDEAFFTEKILNCFATGTVPIYFGATRIGEVFDSRGIIAFSTRDELFAKLRTLSPDDYLSRKDAIIANFQRVQEYLTPEDYIVRHHLGSGAPQAA